MTSRKHFKPKPKDILQRYAALVSASTDQHDYQWQLRLLQSLWREERGFPIGEYRGQPSGNRLAMPEAKETLNNYLTQTIQTVVRREVEGPKRRGKSLSATKDLRQSAVQPAALLQPLWRTGRRPRLGVPGA